MQFKVTSDDDIEKVKSSILATLVLSEKALLVTVEEYSDDRSKSQNSLYWKWLGEIGRETGYTPDEMHLIYKEKFLARIYMRDDTGYYDMAKSVGELKGTPQYAKIKKQVLELTSTRDANVKQFTEYLTNIKYHAQGDMGIVLSLPALEGLV